MDSKELKVPKERLAVLIGKEGEIKKKIESLGHVKLDVNSKTGDVMISGEDSLDVYITKDVVKAIARGFSPKIALKLFKEGYMFDLIDIRDYVGNSKNALERIRGRVIGSEGKARRYLEHVTETNISVFHKTVAIIGEVENVTIARRAIALLLGGSPHGNVYRWLERKKQEMRKRQFEEEHGIL
ncbi:RNA-processing protein [Candidatus Woesearchaeota archaeon]|nr:MAG: RNA-processing protein [Candidatus Woesearchaeota archaeon]